MIYSNTRIFTLLFSFVSFCLFAQGEIRDNGTGEAFPLEVSIEHGGRTFPLQATGVATRKKFFFKIYSVASYLQKGAYNGQSDKFQPIMQDENAKQLTLKFVRGLDAAKVKDAYEESFKNTLSESQYNQLKGEINKFLQFIDHDVNKGDVYILRWLPGGYVEVLFNGKSSGSITNKDFAKGLWNIYFGPNSVVDRNSLVSRLQN